MRNFRVLILILSAVLFLISCDKAESTDQFKVDCNQLRAGIINTDMTIVNLEIAKLIYDLNPDLTTSDPIGHKNNFDILINRINKCNEVSAVLFCYACIKTYPAQSEIIVATDSMGIRISRILDISTPNDNKLVFINIHTAN